MSSEPELISAELAETDLLDTPRAGPAAIRGGILRVGGYGLGMLLSLVSVPLLVRHLGFSEYGRYVTVISLVTIVQGITDVGLSQIGVREFATRPVAGRNRLMRNLLAVRVLLTSVGVCMATAFAAVARYPTTVLAGTAFAGAAMVLTVAQGTFSVPLSAGLRLGWISALDLLRQVLAVLGIVVLVVAGAKLLAFLVLFLPVSIVVLAATGALVRGTTPMRPSFERAEWRLLMRAVLPFAAAAAIGTIYLRITVILMSLLAPAVQTGYYATSFNVLSVLIAIPPLVVGATLPILARAARDDQERLGYVLDRLLEVTAIVGVGLGLVLGVGAHFVIEVLAKHPAAPSVDALKIQSLAIVTQFVASTWQYGLLALHRHRDLLWISIASLAVSMGLTLALVPPLEARGAATALVSAELVLAVMSYYLLKRARPQTTLPRTVPTKIVIAAGLALATAAVPGLSSLTHSIISGLLYLALLVVLRAFPPEILHALRRRQESVTA